MRAMAIVLFGIFLMSWALARQIPEEQRKRIELAADVDAVNFLAYRTAVIDFLNANPSATGTIDDASLTFPLGYIRNPAWTNVVSGGTLFVYSIGGVAPATAERVWSRVGASITAGRNNSGTLFSARGVNTGITIPGAVPNNAIVMVGR